MDAKNLWYLENIDVTNIFCPTKMEGDHTNHANKTFKKGEFIYLPNEDSDKIYFINSGRVKISHEGEANKEITKAILTQGEVFGELALIGQEKRKDIAQALEKTEVCIMERNAIGSLVKNHSGLYMFLMKVIGNRAVEMEKRLESLVFKDSRSRIIEFLLDLNEKRGQRVGYEWVVRKFITHQEIANFTATSRQTVTTVLNELKAKNLLTFDRKRLLLRDLDKIRAEMTVAQ